MDIMAIITAATVAIGLFDKIADQVERFITKSPEPSVPKEHPVVLGQGKRLFSETVKPSALRLVHSQVSTTGVGMSTYVPSGDIQPGSFPSAEPSEKELARRKKMANEMW